MKGTIVLLNLIVAGVFVNAQTSDPGVTSTAAAAGNHAFTGTHVDGTFPNWLDTGYPATAYNLLGNSSKYWGFGGASGDNIESPIIWMYASPRSALRVRTMSYNGDMTTGTDLFTVRANGNVGIGTNGPIATLEVNKNIDGSASAFILNQNTGSSSRSILLLGEHPTGGNYGYLAHHSENYTGTWGDYTNANSTWLTGSDSNGLALIAGNSQGKIVFGTGSSEKMRLSSNGYLGIGTKNPDSRLTVKGKVHAEEVKVDLSVPAPDYVFKEGYDLLSLEETQKYIEKHGHLPNIPSAQEMEADGVELGVMNMKLLEKIEELTLYVLEQDVKIKFLEENFSKIKTQNKDEDYGKNQK